MNGSPPRAWVPFALGAALAIAIAAVFPPWPDDWDGLGFVASVAHFDLASFAPHPPGYPVYVALLKLAAVVTSTPVGAARVVAVLSALVTLLALGRTLPRSGLFAAAVWVTPLVFHAFSGIGSEAPALACVALAAAGVVDRSGTLSLRARMLLVGLGVGLGLGVRLSWAPFFASWIFLLPRPLRLRASLVAGLASLAWAIPLVLVTGLSKLLALGRVHLDGHMNRWGGTALTEPVRLRFLARDLIVDGFGVGSDPLGCGILAALGCATVASFYLWRSRTTPVERRAWAVRAAILVLPYLTWVTFGQNLRQQPRHVLPLLLVGAWALTSAASVAFEAGGRCSLRLSFAVLATLLFARTSLDAMDRRRVPPPGIQLLAYLRAHESPATTVVYTGASGRFLDGSEWQTRTHAVDSVSDAWLALTHEDRLPEDVLVTSEVKGLALESPPAREVALFCRPERLDRRLPCLQLYALDVHGAISR